MSLLRTPLAGLALLLASTGAQALDLPAMRLPNLAGLGVGVTTECSGCKDTMVGVVPGVRYVTESGRLFEWYGPYAQYNFGGLTGFQWGPAVNLKLGRSDVSDDVINKLHDIDTTLEFGGFVGYEYDSVEGAIPYRFRVNANMMTNAGQVYDGARFNLGATLWIPMSERFFIGSGIGATWASQSYVNTYYGVTDADAAASGLAPFHADGGNQQILGWIGAVGQISGHWWGGAGVFMQRLMGDAAESPFVQERGDRNQLTYGAGLGYVW
ncbi:MipA/OmpV family protein [Jeongeupia wiesaeckerbachi]|uniref:MipA/OmpV family protein n=1 Tax=Jeongeupia wiesaeckerbachi TaxID=3051218 RepID=UPI003D8008EB